MPSAGRSRFDGTAGLRAGNGNLPDGDEAWWRAYRERLDAEARTASER